MLYTPCTSKFTCILSIKNPLTGSRITVPQVGEIIRDIPGADGEILVENP